MEKINKFHRAVKTQYDAKVLVFNELEGDLKELDWVSKAEEMFSTIEKLDNKRKEIEDHIDKADRVLNNIETIKYQQNLLPDTSALKDISKLKELDDQLYSLDMDISDIEKRLKMISKLKAQEKDVNLPVDNELQILNAKNSELNTFKGKIRNLNNLIAKIKLYEDDQELYGESVSDIKEEKSEFMDSFSICPFCSQSMEGV